MDKLVEKFRAEAARRLGGRTARGPSYGRELRQLGVACAREGAERGVSRKRVAAALGVHPDTLRHWLATESPISTALVAVRVTREHQAALTVHGPCGVRVDGLDVAALAELLRALA